MAVTEALWDRRCGPRSNAGGFFVSFFKCPAIHSVVLTNNDNDGDDDDKTQEKLVSLILKKQYAA